MIATDSTIFVVVTSSPEPGWIDMWTQSISTWVPASGDSGLQSSRISITWELVEMPVLRTHTHDLLNQKLWGWGSAV